MGYILVKFAENKNYIIIIKSKGNRPNEIICIYQCWIVCWNLMSHIIVSKRNYVVLLQVSTLRTGVTHPWWAVFRVQIDYQVVRVCQMENKQSQIWLTDFNTLLIALWVVPCHTECVRVEQWSVMTSRLRSHTYLQRKHPLRRLLQHNQVNCFNVFRFIR